MAIATLLAGGALVACGDGGNDPDPVTGGTGGGGIGTGGTAGSGAGGAGGSGTAACGPQKAVDADVTANTTWDCPVYLLKKKIYVTNNAKLTIAPGTQILGDPAATDKAALLISRGAQLIAQGTKDKPIVFSSGATAGNRKGGDWAGVALLGNARINTGNPCTTGAGCLDSVVEGIAASEARARFGGVDDASSCGTLEYVRVEFAGAELEPGKELNGLTFAGCGSGTRVDHVQVHRGTDDGIEIFGGKVNLSHVLLTGNEDDSLDWDFGWSGRAQFLVIHQRAGQGDNGIEAAGSPTSETATPRAEPTLSNVTMIGRPDTSGRAITFKEGTRGKLSNFIIQGWKGDVVDFIVKAGDLTTEWPMHLSIENSLFWMNGAYAAEVAGMPSDDDKGFNDQMAVEAAERKNSTTVDPMITSVSESMPNYVPKNAAVGGQATPSFGDTAATYAGAFAPNATSAWTDGWTAFPTN